jgi:hypothetical protein
VYGTAQFGEALTRRGRVSVRRVLITFVIKADADALRDGRCIGWATEVATGHRESFATGGELIRLLGEAANAVKAEAGQ